MTTSDVKLFKKNFNAIYYSTVRDVLSSFENERKKDCVNLFYFY